MEDLTSPKYGTIGFFTTEKYRKQHAPELKDFLLRPDFYWLCHYFHVVCPGRTHDLVVDLVNDAKKEEFNSEHRATLDLWTDEDLQRWKNRIKSSLERKAPSVPGMIEMIFDLVESRTDAIIHLGDFTEVGGKPDSNALVRQAKVHNVPIAHDSCTARAFIRSWVGSIVRNPHVKLFRCNLNSPPSPLVGLTKQHRVLALISHNAKKLDMLIFVAEHLPKILANFDFILTTGTTGFWIGRLMQALGRNGDLYKLRPCLSGDRGGDVQIAFAVVTELCRKVVFLQDPFVTHPHEPDIMLFQQATMGGVEVELATNLESAKTILEESVPPAHVIAA